MNIERITIVEEKTISIDEGIRVLRDLDPTPTVELISKVLIPREHLKNQHIRGATLGQVVTFLERVKEKHGLVYGKYIFGLDNELRLWNHYLNFTCPTKCGSAIEHAVRYNVPILVAPLKVNSSQPQS